MYHAGSLVCLRHDGKTTAKMKDDNASSVFVRFNNNVVSVTATRSRRALTDWWEESSEGGWFAFDEEKVDGTVMYRHLGVHNQLIGT